METNAGSEMFAHFQQFFMPENLTRTSRYLRWLLNLIIGGTGLYDNYRRIYYICLHEAHWRGRFTYPRGRVKWEYESASADSGAGGPMETEAAHVTRMQNRRSMIIMIILGAISQRGIKRTPDEAAINIAQQLAPIKIGTFLRKHKAKVNNEIRKQITKFPTHGMEISGELNNRCPSEMPVLLVICVTQQRRYMSKEIVIIKY